MEVLRRHGANPLLGTTLHENAFATAELLPEVRADPIAKLAMIEYTPDMAEEYGQKTKGIPLLTNGGGFLADRLPIPRDLAVPGVANSPRVKMIEAQRLDQKINGPATADGASGGDGLETNKTTSAPGTESRKLRQQAYKPPSESCFHQLKSGLGYVPPISE